MSGRFTNMTTAVVAAMALCSLTPTPAHAVNSFVTWIASEVINARPGTDGNALSLLHFRAPTRQSASLSISCHADVEADPGLRVNIHSGRTLLHRAFGLKQDAVATVQLDSLQHVEILDTSILREAHIALPQNFAAALGGAQLLRVTVEGGGHATLFAVTLAEHQRSLSEFIGSCGLTTGKTDQSAEAAANSE